MTLLLIFFFFFSFFFFQITLPTLETHLDLLHLRVVCNSQRNSVPVPTKLAPIISRFLFRNLGSTFVVINIKLPLLKRLIRQIFLCRLLFMIISSDFRQIFLCTGFRSRIFNLRNLSFDQVLELYVYLSCKTFLIHQ